MGNYMVSVSIVDPYGCIKETRLLIKINCVRCQRINANFSATCQQCTPLYGPNPKFPNELVIVGYDCTYNLTDLSSPGSLNSQIVSWEWFRNGTDLFSTAQNPTVTLNSGETFPSQQTICLRVRDSNGCIDYFCQSFWVPCNGNSGGRPALGNGEKPTVFPNPTTGTVDVALPAEYSNTTGQILVYNLSGSLIQQVAFDGGQKYYPVDLSNQSGGVYLIRIQAGEYNSVQKVILQK